MKTNSKKQGPGLFLLMILVAVFIAIAIAILPTIKKDQVQNETNYYAKMAITWMLQNMNDDERARYSHIKTTVVDTFWVYPTFYDDARVSRFNHGVDVLMQKAIASTDPQTKDSLLTEGEKLLKLKQQYIEDNKSARGYVLKHVFKINDTADVIYLNADMKAHKIVSERIPPLIEKTIKATTNPQ